MKLRTRLHALKAKSLTALALIATILLTSLVPNQVFASADVTANSGPSGLRAHHAYVVMDASSGKVLLGENYNKRVYPASTTKLMTAIVILEKAKAKGISMNATVTIKSKVLKQVNKDLDSYGLKAGKKYKLGTLINMMLISSYGDATYCAADYVFGSVSACVTAMNKKVKALGLTGTHFDNVGGLDIGNGYKHIYTTALDVAKITQYAQKNTTIANVVKRYSYVVKTSSGKTERTIYSTNKLLTSTYKSSLYTVIGTKTGTTNAAGYVLASTAVNSDGRKVICVYMGKYSSAARFSDSKKVLDYTFTNLIYKTTDPPVLKKAVNSSTGITVSWGAVKNAQKYRLFRKTGSGSWQKIADLSGTSYTDTTAQSGTTYSYTVRCITQNGVNYQSKSATSLTATRLLAPTLQTPTVTDSGLTLTWSSVAGAETYNVYRKVSGGSWTLLANTTELSYTESTGQSNTSYLYTVRGLNGTCMGLFDSTGVSGLYVKNPEISSCRAAEEGISLSWAAVEGAGQYGVYRREENGEWTPLATTSETAYTDTTAASGISYQYAVRCLDTDGQSLSGYSAFTDLISPIENEDTQKTSQPGGFLLSIFKSVRLDC